MVTGRNELGRPRHDKLAEVFLPGPGGFLRREFGRGMNLADGGPYHKGQWVLTGDRPCGCPVEYGNRTPQPESHNSYWILRHPPWVLGGLGDGYSLPQRKYAPIDDINYGGGPLQDISGTLEVLRHPGQVPVPRNSIRLWHIPLGDPDPPYILGPSHHGRKGWRISCTPFQGLTRGDT